MDGVVSFAVMSYMATIRDVIEKAKSDLSDEDFADLLDCILAELESAV